MITENRWAPDEVSAGWGAETELEIGVLEGDEALQLFGVAGGRILSDGRIAVVNGGTHEVRLYDAGGTPAQVFGREGDGPGEFRQPSLAGAVGDTLILYDLTLRRVTVWHPVVGVVREFGVGEEGGGFPVPQGTFADGTIVFGGGLSFSSQTGFPSGLIRQASTFASVTPTGQAGAAFGEFPSAEMYAQVSGSSFSARSIPFGRVTNVAVGDSLFWVGTQDAWELRGFGRDGALRRLLRVSRAPEPVTQELRSRYVEEALADAEDEAERRRLRQTFDEMPFGEAVPPYGAVEVDRTGHLWISDADLPGAAKTVWSVFDPEGRLVGRLELGAATQLLDVAGDRMLVRVTDELGVERVRVLRLTRPG